MERCLFNQVPTHQSDHDLILTSAHWRIAENIVLVLKLMVTVTEHLSEEPMLINMKRSHLRDYRYDTLKKTLTEGTDRR